MKEIEDVERGCGRRIPGGMYLTSGYKGAAGGLLPRIILLEPMILTERTHRAAAQVNGDAILADLPEVLWYAEDGAATKEALATNDLYMFGMPWAKRHSIGVCKGIGDREKGLEKIQVSARVNDVWLLDAITELARHDQSPDYLTLLAGVQEQNAVKVLAAAWRLYNNNPEKGLVQKCARQVAVALGLTADAREMR